MIHLIIYSENIAPLLAPCHKPSYRGLRSLRSLTRGYEWSRPAGGLRRLQWLLMDIPYGGLFQSSFLNTIAL